MFTVTASVSYTFDPEDGMIQTQEEAENEVASILGQLHPSAFTITTIEEN